MSRRTILRGMGAAIALPMLDAMHPALAATAGPGMKPPIRLAFSYVPNGIIMKDWTPQAAGATYDFTRILKPLEPFREDVLVLSGLMDHNGNALGDGPGDHARAAASFLTGVHPKKTAGADIHVGISVDQIAARKVGDQTRFASIELGCEDSRTVGDCDSGYSCAYTNSIAWRTPSSPLPPETNPRAVFERLFGTDTGLDPKTRAQRMAYRKSILDLVQDRTQSLMGNLGNSDRRKVDEYLYAIREIEKRIESAERDPHPVKPSIEDPAGIPVAFSDYVKLMYDLQVVAFQTDMTRVATLVIAREGSVRTYGEIGIPDPHHPLSHHRGNPEWIEKLVRINTFHASMFAYFLGKLKAAPDGDGTLLDHSMLVYGSGISDGNRHTHEDLPVLLAGRGNGSLKTGRHIAFDKETPVTNLYLTLLDRMGVEAETIGDSTGELHHVTELG
ncbi:MAG TPA: DUF1552 domain-containing protein [Bryobacteraceae bacterium]|nr:DUF1552 domain-containing protein [Bryobacteraceae bacterium]